MQDDSPEPPEVALVREAALRVYGYHSHAGKVYVSVTEALRIAAAIVGAARSDDVLDLVSEAAADPHKALDSLKRSQHTLAEEIEVDRQRQRDGWVEAMKSDRRQ